MADTTLHTKIYRKRAIRHGLLMLAIIASMLPLGCIKNDIPFPRIAQNILSISAEGESAPAVISTKNLTVELTMAENTDIRQVRFTDFTYTEGAEVSLDLLEGTYDLTSPIKVILSRYQNYEWIITATQNIERYFTVNGQIGETHIDVIGRRVILYVPSNVDKSALTLTSIKLGPAGVSTMVPDLQAGQKVDFSRPVHIAVTAFGETEDWTIFVDTTEAVVTTTQADAWVNVLWVYGAAPENARNGFQYRRSDASTWTEVPEQYITHQTGTFFCRIPHVEPLTEYIVRAYSDENFGNEITVTTEAGRDLPDASFEQWWKNDKVWCPWDENGIKYWDTGNKGATTLGQGNVSPTEDTPSGQGYAALLETKFVGIASIGKLAAGSIFLGEFVKVDGTNGILSFGRPWENRPTRLRGYYRYHSEPINYTNQEWESLKGQPDSCQIWVALGDWDEPWEIRTNPKTRRLFDKHDPGVIAYGELARGTDTNGYEAFEITLEYYATNRKPKYLLVVAASSKYGDYFTGGTGSMLWLDDLSLDYDY